MSQTGFSPWQCLDSGSDEMADDLDGQAVKWDCWRAQQSDLQRWSVMKTGSEKVVGGTKRDPICTEGLY